MVVLDHVERTRYLETMTNPCGKGRIRGNTKIGPVLEVAVSSHQGRYGIEIKIDSAQKMGLSLGLLSADGRMST